MREVDGRRRVRGRWRLQARPAGVLGKSVTLIPEVNDFAGGVLSLRQFVALWIGLALADNEGESNLQGGVLTPLRLGALRQA
jgi:hypothetical protein